MQIKNATSNIYPCLIIFSSLEERIANIFIVPPYSPNILQSKLNIRNPYIQENSVILHIGHTGCKIGK